MDDMLHFLVIALLTIVVHEFGHYLAFRYYGYSPNFRLKWYGIIIGENVYKKVRLDRYIVIGWAGVLFGLPVAFFDPMVLFLYSFMCSLDLYVIASIWLVRLRGVDIKLYSISSYEKYLEHVKFQRNILNKGHKDMKIFGRWDR